MWKFYFIYGVVLFISIYNTYCEIQVSNHYDDLQFWNDPRLKTRNLSNRRFQDNNLNRATPNMKQNTRKIKKVRLKPDFTRPRAIAMSATKVMGANITWPKVVPRFRAKKASTRMTHMMLQEAEQTSTRYMPLDDDDDSEKLSPYAIKEQLSRISSKFPNTNITIDVIGHTLQFNDIVMMKISELSDLQRHFRAEDDKYADEPLQKKIVFIVHGLSVMGISELPCLSKTKEFTKLMSYYMTHLDNFDIFLIPLANPDGFGKARYGASWNKNMSPQLSCLGVNVDRNFDVAWNTSTIVSSCSQKYPGNVPFSEAESKAIREVFHKYSHKIVAYIHVHAGSYDASSYKGEAVLYPKGYSEVQMDDDKYIDLRGEIDEAIRNASFQYVSVTVDTLYNWYGKVSGTSVDYASTIYGIPYAMELVMQVYNDYYMDTSETYSDSALNEIWNRVMNVIFNNIWKNMQTHDS